jgi:Putative auto-transporter adhesin, head GIN domain
VAWSPSLASIVGQRGLAGRRDARFGSLGSVGPDGRHYPGADPAHIVHLGGLLVSRHRHSPGRASLVLALIAAGCMTTSPFLTKVGTPPYTAGSGVSASVTRPLSPFTAIRATSAVRVTIVAGDLDEAVVTTDDNLLDAVVTDVRDGTLIVTIEGSIETRLLPTIAVTASGPVDSIVIESAARLTATDLDLGHLSALLSSAATFEASGAVGSLDLDVSSGSTADLHDLVVVDADVSISSGSTATVRVSDTVEGACLTGSTLHLLGHPGSGTVTTDAGSKVEVE